MTCTGMLVLSCVDMDLSPKGMPSDANVWDTPNLAEQTIAGVYNQLYEDFNSIDDGWFDSWSSLMDNSAGRAPSFNFLFGNNSPSSVNGSSAVWQRYYKGIVKANDVIGHLPMVVGFDEEKRSRYISECTFLRSWWYYRLNILYNGVPYYCEPINDINEVKLPRSTQNEIWQYLIKDLTSCIDNPNLPDKYDAEDVNFGHITKGAAYALRGKVYMWLKEWKKAADDFQAVKDCGYVLYTEDGQDSYKQLFKIENECCDEIIFSLRCMDLPELGQNKNRGYGNRCSPPDESGNGLGFNTYVINPQFVDSYENIDGSKFNWDDIIPGYNDMTAKARMVYFLRDEMTEAEMKNAEKNGADMSKYLKNGNEARVRNAYKNRDPRMEMSVITPYATFIGGVEGTAKEYVMRFPFRSYTTWRDLKTDSSTKLFYLNRKFVGEGMELPKVYSELDLPLIRYAEVLLNWAESLNELGDLQGAIEKVNEVRARAGVQLLGTNQFTRVQDKNDMHQRIMNEAHWELVGEDVIYFDELRWRTWKKLKFYQDKEGKMNGRREVWGSPLFTYSWGGEQYWNLPIPAREIQMNPNMTQNPGWE